MTDLFSRDTKVVRNYVGVLVFHLRSVSRPFRLPRPHIEEELLKIRKQGLVLIGPPGTGKTTFMHFMVREQAKEVLEQPRAAQVPILVSATKWGEQEAVDVLRTTMQSYYPVPDRTFTRLLKRGQLMCFFDSLDETLTSDAFLAKLKTFHLEYPNNPLILSTQPPGHSVIEGLAPIEIPSLTTSEES